MATQEKTWNVANRLHSQKDSDNPEVNHIIAGADEIYDDTKGAKQSDINAQTDAALSERYTKDETYSKEQLDALITTPDVNYVTVATFADLPQTGEANTIYRVSFYDGSQVDASKYALYAWDGTSYQLLAVRSAVGEVFDVSEYNSGATYETLTAALAAVPASVQRGGMSIKFIQLTPATYSIVKTEGLTEQPTGTKVQEALAITDGTYTAAQLPVEAPATTATYWMAVTETVDGVETTTYTSWVITKATNDSKEYVQYRLMAADWSNVVGDWQGVDSEPIAGSRNLVESRGVFEINKNLSLKINDIPINAYSVNTTGYYGTSSSYTHRALSVVEGESYYIEVETSNFRYCFATEHHVTQGGLISLVDGTVVETRSIGEKFIVQIPAGCKYLLLYGGFSIYRYLEKVVNPDKKPVGGSDNSVTSSGVAEAIGTPTVMFEKEYSYIYHNVIGSVQLKKGQHYKVNVTRESTNTCYLYLCSGTYGAIGTKYITLSMGPGITEASGEYIPDNDITANFVTEGSNSIQGLKIKIEVYNNNLLWTKEQSLTNEQKRQVQENLGLTFKSGEHINEVSITDEISNNDSLATIGSVYSVKYPWNEYAIITEVFDDYELILDGTATFEKLNDNSFVFHKSSGAPVGFIYLGYHDFTKQHYLSLDYNLTKDSSFNIVARTGKGTSYDIAGIANISKGSGHVNIPLSKTIKGNYIVIAGSTLDAGSELTLSNIQIILQDTGNSVKEAIENIEEHSDDDIVEMIKQAKYVASDVTVNSLGLLHYSDIHEDDNAAKSIEEWCAKYGNYIDDVICTGDVVQTYLSKNNGTRWYRDLPLPNIALFVLGNHDQAYTSEGNKRYQYFWADAGENGDGNIDLTIAKSEAIKSSHIYSYTKYFADYIENWGVTMPSGYDDPASPYYQACYWHKDYTAQKIRLIGVDCMYRFDGILAKDGNNDFIVDSETGMLAIADGGEGLAKLTTEQETWLKNLLDETLDSENAAYGYSVVVICHYPLDDCDGFNSLGSIGSDSRGWSNVGADGGIVLNHRTGDTVNFHYGSADAALTLSGTFDLRNRVADSSVYGFHKGDVNNFGDILQKWQDNGGQFVAWICGHTHIDRFYYPKKYPNMLCVVIDQAGSLRGSSIEYRKQGEYNNNCANYYSIDTQNGLFKIVRLGLNSDKLLTAKNYLCYNYKNKIVVNEG